MKNFLTLIFLAFAISETSFGQMPNITAGVSKELAKWRAEKYSNVYFKLSVELEKMSPTIKGTAEISLFNKGDLIVLDWRKLAGKENLSKISKLSVNGKPAYFEELNGHLILKEGVLENKSNTIRLDFTSPIADDASVKRFIDEKDGAEYVYSQFSANGENTTFPIFDQLNLKSKFSLTVKTSDTWKVISNTSAKITQNLPVSHSEDAKKGLYETSFEETEPISTYVFAFAAGDFAEFTDIADIGPTKTAPKGSSTIYEPLKNPNAAKIYVRKSQAEKFKKYELEFFRLNRTNDKSAKLDIILLPEISNSQNDYDGIKFVPESSVFR